MRISGGEAKGTKLKVPRGARPASERVRQAIFSSLGDVVAGANVLDLYCGSGAYGLEALSRGAAHATFVDLDASAAAASRANAQAAGFSAASSIRRASVDAYLSKQASDERFDLVFADPPYASSASETLLGSLDTLIATGGTVVVETRWSDSAVDVPEGYLLQADRRYGDTRVLMFLRRGLR